MPVEGLSWSRRQVSETLVKDGLGGRQMNNYNNNNINIKMDQFLHNKINDYYDDDVTGAYMQEKNKDKNAAIHVHNIILN